MGAGMDLVLSLDRDFGGHRDGEYKLGHCWEVLWLFKKKSIVIPPI
jgi:hypothetical protein